MKYTGNKSENKKQSHHRRLSYCNQLDNGFPLYFNYDNDTTLTFNSTPASDIAVVGTQRFDLC